MEILNRFKKHIACSLEYISPAALDSANGGGRVLVLGDGVSAIHASKFFDTYEKIICTNLSVMNRLLIDRRPEYYINIDPRFLVPSFLSTKILCDARPIIMSQLNKIKGHVHPFFHSYSRLFLHNFRSYSPSYLSSNRFICGREKSIYGDFSGSFQAALGLALLLGFEHIDIAGYDAWFLSPTNNIRWYSECYDLLSEDHHLESSSPEFLDLAASIASIRVYTYAHYHLKYSYLDEIYISDTEKYIPAMNRSYYIDESVAESLYSWERTYFPKGYEVRAKIAKHVTNL